MIGDDARLSIDKARPHRAGRPAEDAIETKKRIPGREGWVLRASGQFASERAAQRSRPEPFVEVAQHHRRHGVRPRDCDKPARLLAPLGQGQAEMRGDQPECPGGRCDLDLDSAARFTLGMGDVVDLSRA